MGRPHPLTIIIAIMLMVMMIYSARVDHHMDHLDCAPNVHGVTICR